MLVIVKTPNSQNFLCVLMCVPEQDETVRLQGLLDALLRSSAQEIWLQELGQLREEVKKFYVSRDA